MDDFTVYILYSNALHKYYVGCTSLTVEERLRRHNSNHSGFTGKANDWTIQWSEWLPNKKVALAREQQIKKRGARRFLQNKEILSVYLMEFKVKTYAACPQCWLFFVDSGYYRFLFWI